MTIHQKKYLMFSFSLRRQNRKFLQWYMVREFSKMAEAKEIRIPIPYGHISGRVWNEGAPTVVLGLHGWLDNAGTFDTLAPLLPKSLSLVSIDVPGHGLSSYPPLGTSSNFLDMVIVVERIVKHFGWKEVNLLGHSMGGGVAMLYAGTFPEKVNKIVMLDLVKPMTYPTDTCAERTRESIEQAIKLESKLNSQPPSYDYTTIVERMVKSYGHSLTEESAKLLLKRGSQINEDGTYSFQYDPRLKTKNLLSMTLDQQKKFAERIQCEMIIVKASLGPLYEDKSIYDEIMSIYEKNAKSFKYITVEGTHHVHLNTPEAVAPIINKFFLEQTNENK